MQLTKFYKNIVQTTLHNLNAHLSRTGSAKSFVVYYSHTKTKLLRILSPNLPQCRSYTSDAQNYVQLPALTDDPKLLWPTFFSAMSCFFKSNFVIKPSIDSDFNTDDFLLGAKQALSVVSNALATEDYESIKDSVTSDVIERLRNKISTLTPEQKQLIAVNKDDVYLTFPYQINISDKAEGTKSLEITVIYYSLRGLQRMKEENKDPPMNMGMLPEYQRLMFICNYRFIREYAKNVESSWTINMINHFMPATLSD